MELLSIGAFARASRLSPKALRLYDALDLLPPAHVDPATGYRWYAPEQLDRARLVAWLRRLGMPLARIRHVCDLAPPTAAAEVTAFWGQVEAETAGRRELATFLVDHLSGKDPTMTETHPLAIRYAALTDAGRIRESNQDAAYADDRLLAVADGFGAGGGPAAAAAVAAVRQVAARDGVPAGDLLNLLEEAVEDARRAVGDVAARDATPTSVGTTLTAMLWTGSRLALVHIGDSRAYLVRDGGLFQITHDHTHVQTMVDDGRLTPEEAASHPQRAMLVRALSPELDAPADTRLRDARPGDRYLLCSDGLSAVVTAPAIREVLRTVTDPAAAVRELVGLANAAGGPDNVSCVVADVYEGAA
jgi:PPM family protein phosphatase